MEPDRWLSSANGLHLVEGDEGLALIVEHGDEIMLAGMVVDLTAAGGRAAVRDVLLPRGSSLSLPRVSEVSPPFGLAHRD